MQGTLGTLPASSEHTPGNMIFFNHPRFRFSRLNRFWFVLTDVEQNDVVLSPHLSLGRRLQATTAQCQTLQLILHG